VETFVTGRPVPQELREQVERDEGEGNVLRRLRRQWGLNLGDVAGALDINVGLLSRFERNLKAPSGRVLARMVAVLELNPEELHELVTGFGEVEE
jgi:transcriptional regulator with XRE-family HTH domain